MLNVKVDKDTIIDICKCPHILIGGSTGSGKSYLMKNMLCDILESDVSVVVLDPKSVDYKFLVNERSLDSIGRGGMRKVRNIWSGRYESVDGSEYYKERWQECGTWLGDRDSIDSMEALSELKLIVKEMYRRYQIMKMYGIVDWSEVECDRKRWEHEGRVCDGSISYMLDKLCKEGKLPIGEKRLVVMIDELADLIYWDRQKSMERLAGYEVVDVYEDGFGRELEELEAQWVSLDKSEWKALRGSIEDSLVRISILGRAAGIHLVLGTQRPDASVLSGQLRANLPCRICLRVSNSMERRIILGQTAKEYGERVLMYQSQLRDLKYELC